MFGQIIPCLRAFVSKQVYSASFSPTTSEFFRVWGKRAGLRGRRSELKQDLRTNHLYQNSKKLLAACGILTACQKGPYSISLDKPC